jgi:ABC-type transporter Mla maintaining outer membrane lipid asymmetry ATPase subunit MlaF
VTHQLQYLKYVSHIVLMHAGKIEAQGTYDELISTKSNLIQSLAASTESSEVEGGTTEVCSNLKSSEK